MILSSGPSHVRAASLREGLVGSKSGGLQLISTLTRLFNIACQRPLLPHEEGWEPETHMETLLNPQVSDKGLAAVLS